MKRIYARRNWINPAESFWMERGWAESQPQQHPGMPEANL